MANVSFKYGSYDSYKALAMKSADTLYFTTDTLQIFKGDKEYTKSCQLVTSLPESGQVQGVVYIRSTDMTLHIYNGTGYTQLNKAAITAITDGATDDNVPTAKAVADYVTSKIDSVTGDVSKAIKSLKVDGNTVSFYTSNNMTGDAAFTVDFPTEMFLDQTKTEFVSKFKFSTETYVGATDPKLDGKPVMVLAVKGENPASCTYSFLNMAALVDTYKTKADGKDASTTIEISGYEIEVKVNVSSEAGNVLFLKDDGLYVDSYSKAAIDEKVKTVSDSLNTHKNDAVAHITADERTKWNAKPTQDELTAAKEAAIAAAATDATTKANAARDAAKEYADGLNTAMDTRVKAVESAVAWTTIA